MQRGDVFWYEPDPVLGSEQAGRRPAVVVSRDAINRSSRVVVVVPLTTYRGQRFYPSDVLIGAPEGGLPMDSVAMALHIRAVDKQRLGSLMGRLSAATVRELEQAILRALDIEP
jgi:mRNA interferase MazF